MEKKEILSELENMKAALEASLTEKSAKNVDEKISAVNAAIEDLKAKKPEVSVEELNSVKATLDTTIKALDILQSRSNVSKSDSKPMNWKSAVSTIMSNHKAAIENFKGGQTDKLTLKDMTIADSLTGNIPYTYSPTIQGPGMEMTHARALFSVIPSATDSFHFYRHTVGEGGLAFQTNENSAKSALAEDLTEVTVNLNYLAGFLRISRKMLKNFVGLQTYLGQWLPEEYYQTEDAQAYTVLTGATGTPVTSGSSMVENIILTVGSQMAAKKNVNFIAVNGSVWASILANKTTGNEFTLPGGSVVIAPSGALTICGIPVVVASWVPAATAIVGDSTKFGIVQSEGLSLQFFEQDSDNVQKNKITARIEASVGFALLDPAAFAIID